MKTKEKETNENFRTSMYRDWKLVVHVVYSMSDDALTYLFKVVIVPQKKRL